MRASSEISDVGSEEEIESADLALPADVANPGNRIVMEGFMEPRAKIRVQEVLFQREHFPPASNRRSGLGLQIVGKGQNPGISAHVSTQINVFISIIY